MSTTQLLASMIADGEVSHDTLLTTMVALFGLAIGSPIMVMLVQSRRSRADRVLDERSRREIAAELLQSNAEVASRAHEIAERTDRNLTKVMEGERAAVEQALGAITEAINMKLSVGEPVLPESYAAQAKLDEQLSALSEAIRERHKTMRLLDSNGESPEQSRGASAGA